ncbi:MAG: HlyD family efflux transporter periplasmic adaptor subunit, partial [Opitutaceae bacterium]|nr:HlyD family efflux transporter periplasmic adaptor subunit [Opitutaceae bacterium]
MTAHPNAAAHVQRQLNDVSARLAQLAKESPDLPVYLKAHAECILQILRPQGISYEMLAGRSFQRMVASNWESLNLKDSPELAESFRKAIHRVAETGHPVTLPARLQASSNLPGLQPQDAPAPEELSLFNSTEFEQYFVPILSGSVVSGVLHVWFIPIDAQAGQLRAAILRQICGEVELYLKARRSGDLAAEVTRVSTYAKLLEEISGDNDVESVGWHIVNYAREAVACDRVSLLVAKGRGDEPLAEDWIGLDQDYELGASSGLRRPHPRSEQAVVLKRLAERLTQMSLANSAKRKTALNGGKPTPALNGTNGAHAVNGQHHEELVSKPLPAADGDASGSSGEGATLPDAQEDLKPARTGAPARPQMQLTLVQRDPAKVATRPSEVNDYFDAVPMNWATVMPLFDRQERVRGILLFEGVKKPEKLDATIIQMRDLAISAGRTLGAALYWQRQPAARMARRWINTRNRVVNTPRKEKWTRFGLPVLIIVIIMALPITFSVKGAARVLPRERTSLAAYAATRLLSVDVREGQTVKKGEVLARFDTTDVELQIRAAQQEVERGLVEVDAARGDNDEIRMQVARLATARARTALEKLQRDLDRMTLRAPFDGIVLGAQNLSARIGQVPRPGEGVLEVIDPSTWKVQIDVREQDLRTLDHTLQKNGPVEGSVRLAANPTQSYPLEVTSSEQLAYGLDTTHGEFLFQISAPLKVEPSQLDLLKSGFAGRASFDCGRRPI